MTAPAKVGKPDGPEQFIAEIGYAVGTFTQRREDLEEDARRKALPCLMHHVPSELRGPYRVTDLPKALQRRKYKTNADGYVMCRAANKRARSMDSPECNKRAMNRSPNCEMHGGRLHPMDRRIEPEVDVSKLTRWEQLCRGYISVDDLDDEELLRGMTRRPNGSFPGGVGKAVPRKVYDKMVARLFERAQEMFRENLFSAIGRLAFITQNDAFEPADQIKAANLIIDRVLGKTPEKVDLNIGAQKPWEQIIASVGGTLDEYERTSPPLDVEVVETEGNSEPWQDLAISSPHPEGKSVTAQEESSTTEPLSLPESSDVTASTSSTDTQSSPATPAKKRRRIIRRADYTSEGEYQADLKLERAELKEERDAGQKRRYAARQQGATQLTNLAYHVERKVLWENGKVVETRLQFVHPNDIVVPPQVKAAQTKRRNRERDQ